MDIKQTVILKISRLLGLAAIMLGLGGLLFQRAPVAAQQAQLIIGNAASFARGNISPDSLAVAAGAFVTQGNQNFNASGLPLPTTLGGVRLTVNGVAAGLLFVGPTQINFLVPPGLQDAPSATVTVTNSDNSTRTGTVTIVRSVPGIFTANASGTGVAAALTTMDGANFTPIFNPDGTPRDVNAGTAQQPNALVLFVTGIRSAPAQNPSDANGVAEGITVTVQGVPLNVLFAGAAPGFAGLDQINAILPPEAAGLGLLDIEISINNSTQRSNKATLRLGGQLPPVRVTTLAADQTVNGALAADDQIQMIGDGSRRTYFFDAYRFTSTQPNTTIAVDLRKTDTSNLDVAVLLYQVSGQTLVQVGVDDETGGYGNGQVDNHNALLLMVLATPGDYVVFVTSADVQPNGRGAYSLRLSQNVIQQVNYGANLNATIANTDIQTSAGDYLDVYWFTAAANDNVSITMRSSAFDSFLILKQNDGVYLTDDDNSGGNRDARLTRRLGTAGIYIIIGTPFEPNRTGAYTFNLDRLTSLADELETQAGAPGRSLRELRGEPRSGMAVRGVGRVIEE